MPLASQILAFIILILSFPCGSYGADGEPVTWRFESLSRGLPQSGQWRHGFAVADLNRDGWAELIHAAPRPGGQPVIFQQIGEGSWGPLPWVSFPAQSYSYGDVAVLDLDGDSVLDLVLAQHYGPLVPLRAEWQGKKVSFKPFDESEQQIWEFSSRAVETFSAEDGTDLLFAFGEGPAAGLRHRADQVRPSYGIAVYRRIKRSGWTRNIYRSELFGDSFSVEKGVPIAQAAIAFASRAAGESRLLAPALLDSGAPFSDLPELSDATVWATAFGDLDRDGTNEVLYSADVRREARLFIIERKHGKLTVRQSFEIPKVRRLTALAVLDYALLKRPLILALDELGNLTLYRAAFDEPRLERLANFQLAKRCRGYDLQLFSGEEFRLGNKEWPVVIASFASEPAREGCETGGALVLGQLQFD